MTKNMPANAGDASNLGSIFLGQEDRRKQHPTLVFLPEEFWGQRAGYSPWVTKSLT